jgi:hypothetical protein
VAFRPKLAAALTAAALAALAAVLILPTAKADPPADKPGAVVINDQGCGLFDGNGGFAFADSDHVVVTPSGNQHLKCRADVTPPASGKAVHYDTDNNPFGPGTVCAIVTPAGFVTTEDWRETVSASGRATLTCKG